MLDASVIGSLRHYRRRLAQIENVFDGSQDWAIAGNNEVANSGPASGSNAGVAQGEHVNSEFIPVSVVFWPLA